MAAPAAASTTPVFEGRVVSSTHDVVRTDVSGPHTVMYPISTADVSTALTLARRAKRPIILRSGAHAVTRDTVDGTGAVVINLQRLRGVTVDGPRVSVGPATTVEMLADELVKKDLFLPLQENLLQSVVAAVLSDDPGCLSRSAGFLREYLESITVLRTDGTIVVAKQGQELFEDVLARTQDGVITALEFLALSHQAAKRLWLAQISLPFSEKVFRLLVSRTFKRRAVLPEDVDVVVKAVTTVLGHPLIVCTIAGDEDADRDAILAGIKRHVAGAEAELGLSDDAPEIPHIIFEGKDIVQAISDAGELGGFSNGLASTKHIREVTRREFPVFASNYARLVSYALGTRESGEVHFPGVSLSSRLVLTEEGTVDASALFFTPEEMSPAESRLFRMINSLIPQKAAKSAIVSLEAEVPLEDFDAPLEALEDPDWRAVAAADPRSLAGVITKERIPGFGGPVYTEDDGAIYVDRAKQYATSSYPAADMTPLMVAYPEDIDDIQNAVVYATKEKLNIVARSGGHQYSGLSSGGSKTIVMSMDNFNQLQVVGNRATVGVGSKLTDIAAAFKREGVTIPHGECPLVCIGGHAQSGGYGHLLRSYGLALDYVSSFDIVTGDGTYQTVRRPKTAGEKGLFWAVLGGGPSSFGVLTSITFEAIRDVDHPFSRGHGSVRFFQKAVFGAVMETVRDWSVAIQSNDRKLPDGTVLPDDLDMMATAISTDFPVRWGILHGLILLEMVHGNVKGDAGKAESLQAQAMMDSVAAKLEKAASFYNPTITRFQGPKPLSFMSDEFVRRTGTTPDGREFKYPYEKRLNGTDHALTPGFVKGFTDIVDETIHDKDVRLVFQMGLGGAAYRNSAQRPVTSCSRRDAAFQVVYDVFYTPGHKDRALELQNKMKALLVREFPEGEEVRLFWGSYGDTEITNVWKNYVDSEDLYKQLQKVKADVDVNDVFHTRFTIPVSK